MKHLPGFVLLLALAACSAKAPVVPAPVLDPARITEDVRILASDEFEGRGPATPGEQKTVDYLVGRLKALGVEPGGDPLPAGGRAWTQDVPLMRTEIDGPVRVEVRKGRDTLSWTQGEQVALRAAQTGETRIELQDAPLVFVGYGVSAPERSWDDFKGMDLKGKVALILVNDPDFETGEGAFGGKAMTYYGRWTYKYEEMARRGAAGALVIHETEPAAYGWLTVKNSNTNEAFDVLREDPKSQHVPVQGWIQRDATVEIMRKAGLDFDELKTRAQKPDFQPVVLDGVTFSTRFDVKKDQVVSRNIVGVLPGAKHPEEWVFYTSHWDHMGIGAPDATGDTIYNGALDNAAGVAQVLEIARNFAEAPRTDRSVGFMLVAVEEKGLLGSEYYATNPLYPLPKTVAILNTDAPRAYAPAKDFSTAGDAPTTLQDMLVEVGAGLGRSYTPESRPEAGLFFRSDHFPFAKRGVPAISYRSGENLPEGATAGKDWTDLYTRERYHQPSDEFDPQTWRSDGIAADGVLLYTLGRRLADSRDWPEWKQGAEFKAARDATATERQQQ